MKFSLTTLLPLLSLATAQKTTSIYTEPKTSIAFQTFTDATTGYTFGLTLPTTPTTDFIGLLVGKGKGWAGLSLGGAMTNKLLIAAWPSGTKIVATFRETAKIGNPPEATGTYTMTPIDAGTYVNATHWSYTFLCKGCILADGTTFAASASSDSMGWAFATSAPATPASHGSALMKHAAQGQYKMDFAGAKSAKYATYAAMAGNGTMAGMRFKA